MISCTSPSDSTYGLPISLVTRRDSASLLLSTRRPIFCMTRERIGAGTAAHSSCTSRAALHAATKVPASPRRTSATASSVRAGLTERVRPPGASSSVRPPTMEATVRAADALSSRVSVVRIRRPPESSFPTSLHPTPCSLTPLLWSRIGWRTQTVTWGRAYGNHRQGNSGVSAHRPQALGAQDLPPLHRRRHHRRGCEDGK